MQNSASPEFEALLGYGGITKDIVDAAVSYGLRYEQIPENITQLMIEHELPIEVIVDEIRRQLNEMPSRLFH